MATNNNINYGPAALPGTVSTPVLGNNIDRAPAPVAPGVGTGYVPTVSRPVVPVTEQPVINPPIIVARTAVVIPVAEQPVAEVVAESTAGPNIPASNQQRYLTILANGSVVTDNASSLDFEGNGFTITSSGVNGAVISINAEAGGYGNSNVATLLAAFGSNTLSTTGNVTGGYILGNGSQLTGIAATYGNANVVANLAALGSNPVSTTGNVTGGNLTTAGIANIASLAVTGSATVQGSISISDSSTSLSATGNVIGGNVKTGGIVSATGNVIGGNLTTVGIVSATGNVTGNYFIGNGSQLTGLAATYGNANVAANLASFGSNPVSTSGNITGGNILGGANVNATTHTGTTVSASGNITGGNVLTGGLISATGNVTSGNVSTGVITLTNGATIRDTSGDSVVFGQNAGLTSQAQHAVAIGINAGRLYQGEDSVAIGYNAGYYDQGRGVAIGWNAGQGGVLFRSVSDAQGGSGPVRNYVSGNGNPTLTLDSVVNVTVNDLVFGNNIPAGAYVVSINAPNINISAPPTAALTAGDDITFVGLTLGINDASNIVLYMRVIGTNIPANTFVQSTGCSLVTLNQYPTAPLVNGASITFNVGQGFGATAIGYQAGESFQDANAVAVGSYAGYANQGAEAVAVGYQAGYQNQGNAAVAMGRGAGQTTQGHASIAMGFNAGLSVQGNAAVAIGEDAGQTSQGEYSVAVGAGTGNTTQGDYAVAVGAFAGNTSQGNNAVAVGVLAGYTSQGSSAVAMGYQAGYGTQGSNAVAIGTLAGYTGQGTAAVAIGTGAGYTNQGNNSIIINATAANLDQTTANTFTVAPVRNDVANTANVMFYNATSKEVTYGNTISVAGNITGGNILFGSGIVSGTGNITGGNVLTGGLISATGNVSGGNLNVTGNIVDTGALSIITGGNGNIAFAPNGTGIVTSSGAISAVGNVTGGNLTTASLTSTASLSVTGNTATITTANYSIGYLNIPQISLAANTTTALTDSGKHYYSVSASNLTLTIANNTSVSWPIGTAISIVNRGTANIIIAGGTGVSVYLAGNSSAGNRFVTTYGMATVMNVAANIWMINGTVS